MKWILIGRKEDKENITALNELFSSKKIECVEIYADDENFTLDVSEIWSVFASNSYCVFFSADKITENKNLLFLLGCLSSATIPTFFNGEGDYTIAGASKLPANFFCFSDAKRLPDEVKKQLPKFNEEEKRRNAYLELFNKGLPFTPDSFAAAISKEKTEICDLYINAGMDINSVDSEGTPLLSVAVRNDCEEMVKWILNKGADINVVSVDRGYTPVMDAVWRKNLGLTKLLIEKGAKLDTISKEGQSILVLAVGNGNAEICEELLKNGADSETKDMMGMSARGYANLFKKPAIVEVFEKYPAK